MAFEFCYFSIFNNYLNLFIIILLGLDCWHLISGNCCFKYSGDYQNSEQFLSQSLSCTKHIYGHMSVEYGNELHKQATILFQCHRMCDALDSASEAGKVLRIHYSAQHQTTRDIANLIKNIKMILNNLKQ